MCVLRNNMNFSGRSHNVCLCACVDLLVTSLFLHMQKSHLLSSYSGLPSSSLPFGIHFKKLNCQLCLNKGTLHTFPPMHTFPPTVHNMKDARFLCLPNEMLRNTTQKWLCCVCFCFCFPFGRDSTEM